MALLLVLLWAGFGIFIDGYLTEPTASNVLSRSVTVGLLAAGLTICLLAGQIDLSIGSTLAASGVVLATVEPRQGLVLGIVAGILGGTAVGAINAFLVCVVQVNSFVATLGTLLLVKGAAFVVSGGTPLPISRVDAALRIADPIAGPISLRVIILVALVALASLFVTRTRWGRDIMAIGGHQAAAEAAGIPVRRRISLAFLISGTLAGISGVVLGISLASASPSSGGVELLTAAAAAFLGGVALTGGRGSVISSVLAVVALSSLGVGLELSFVHPAYQTIITGLILVAVAARTFAGVPELPDLLRQMVKSLPRRS